MTNAFEIAAKYMRCETIFSKNNVCVCWGGHGEGGGRAIPTDTATHNTGIALSGINRNVGNREMAALWRKNIK